MSAAISGSFIRMPSRKQVTRGCQAVRATGRGNAKQLASVSIAPMGARRVTRPDKRGRRMASEEHVTTVGAPPAATTDLLDEVGDIGGGER
jgi:hypothetical protein